MRFRRSSGLPRDRAKDPDGRRVHVAQQRLRHLDPPEHVDAAVAVFGSREGQGSVRCGRRPVVTKGPPERRPLPVTSVPHRRLISRARGKGRLADTAQEAWRRACWASPKDPRAPRETGTAFAVTNRPDCRLGIRARGKGRLANTAQKAWRRACWASPKVPRAPKRTGAASPLAHRLKPYPRASCIFRRSGAGEKAS